ncbi:hypothetical protein QR680_013277 [Steinernema hermaphroditum]|uniref:MULE transposase domain-containing protein n=1 Tax=Steinernema hermaphroditum TaxID=289476 RepID=A0AA39I7K2_9BILA|nr:hypothetical protein QR680_013277 [Steinernema hermaphroditum]
MKFRISIVTVAGLNAQHDDPVYQEKLLIFKSPELAIFMSPYGSRLLKRSNHIIADGTFKYALAANPFAVVLMTRRTRSDYELMWNTLRESLNAVPGSLQIQYAHFDLPHSLAEISFPPDLLRTKTCISEDFLLADTGSDDEHRIIIFACRTDYERLMGCKTWLADGTFKVAPEMFYQLWVIHGLYVNKVLPLIYCLLPNKSEETYTRALELVHDAHPGLFSQLTLKNVFMDFEKAEENRCESTIPRCQHSRLLLSLFASNLEKDPEVRTQLQIFSRNAV